MVTIIIRADIVVATVFVRSRYANSFAALIINGTRVVIIARVIVIGIYASSVARVAIIVGTRVIVVADLRCSFTCSVIASVFKGTSVVIVTRSVVVGVHAVTIFVTVIIGTRVVVIAILRISSYAISFGAHVVKGTSFVIIAREIVVGVCTRA
jgi:hypothetical protein